MCWTQAMFPPRWHTVRQSNPRHVFDNTDLHKLLRTELTWRVRGHEKLSAGGDQGREGQTLGHRPAEQAYLLLNHQSLRFLFDLPCVCGEWQWTRKPVRLLNIKHCSRFRTNLPPCFIPTRGLVSAEVFVSTMWRSHLQAPFSTWVFPGWSKEIRQSVFHSCLNWYQVICFSNNMG